MLIYVYDEAVAPIGVVEKITSLIWKRKYGSCGDFKLLVPFTEEHNRLLQINAIIMKQFDCTNIPDGVRRKESAAIQYRRIRKDANGHDVIEAQGKFITFWLSKRIVLNQIIATDTPPNIMRRIISENLVNPTDARRKVPELNIDASGDFGRADIEYTSEQYINVMTEIENQANAAKLGFDILTDDKTKQHYFRVYDGIDRTADRSVNTPCVFSMEFDNILEQEFMQSSENCKTTAYVHNATNNGHSTPISKIVEVGDGAAGLDRSEVLISSPETDDTGMMFQKGSAELEQYAEVIYFSSKVSNYANLKYGADYNLGDLVTCVNKRWGVKINTRITEITETYQSDKQDIDIIFGEGEPTLAKKLRQLM